MIRFSLQLQEDNTNVYEVSAKETPKHPKLFTLSEEIFGSL